MKKRRTYLLLIIGTIIIGLLSRKTTMIPKYAGDLLYATMMFFIVRFCLIKDKISRIAWISLGICFAIEFSQLCRATWLNHIRATLPGRLILGQGFNWSDLPAYVLGVALGCLMETLMKRNR